MRPEDLNASRPRPDTLVETLWEDRLAVRRREARVAVWFWGTISVLVMLAEVAVFFLMGGRV